MKLDARVESRRDFQVGAFTLIELLVVIAIMGILAAILLPVMRSAFRKSEVSQAQTEVNMLATAFKAYRNEYHVNPTNLTRYPSGTGYDLVDAETTATGIQVEEGVVRMLRGENIRGQNPRRIVFMELADATIAGGYFVDPWNQPYKYMLDYDFSGYTHIWFTGNSGETNLPLPVGVWSRGPDGSDENGRRGDDPRSW